MTPSGWFASDHSRKPPTSVQLLSFNDDHGHIEPDSGPDSTVTVDGAPAVAPSGIVGRGFRDEVDAGNRAARQLTRQGVEAIVVLLHEGGSYDGCLCPPIDALVTGHTHAALETRLEGGADQFCRDRVVPEAADR